MMTAPAANEFQARLQRLDALLTQPGHFVDPATEARIRDIVQAVLDLHGVGLERLLEIAVESNEGGSPLFEALAGDQVVSGLLLLHGLHPEDLGARVMRALESVRPYLQSHGGGIELMDLRDGIVRLRFHGSCDGCPSSAQTMKESIERAIQEAAPDVAAIELIGISPGETVAGVGGARLALPILQ